MRQIVIMALLLLQTVAVLAQEKIETIFKIVLNDPSAEILSAIESTDILFITCCANGLLSILLLSN